jgi:hypothetical protein
MITILLIVHGLLAVALLGAITHQALSVRGRRSASSQPSFVDKFQGVRASSFTNTIVLLFVLTCIGGAFLYPQYRLDVRPTIEEMRLRAANGAFEIKEHFAAVGLGLLPAYWMFWRPPLVAEHVATRRNLTWMLAFVIWSSFLIGHVLNNIKGLTP